MVIGQLKFTFINSFLMKILCYIDRCFFILCFYRSISTVYCDYHNRCKPIFFSLFRSFMFFFLHQKKHQLDLLNLFSVCARARVCVRFNTYKNINKCAYSTFWYSIRIILNDASNRIIIIIIMMIVMCYG